MRVPGLLVPLLAVALGACAPAASRAPSSESSGLSPDSGRTLVLLTHVEPVTLSRHRAFTGTGATPGSAVGLFNAALFASDEREVSHPYLVERMPEVGTDDWRVLPDGRMQTTYRLRPSLTWHDGVPLAAEDFVFSWRVSATPELGVATLLPHRLIEEVSAVDQRTLVVDWRQPFPMADALNARDFSPLPRHILESAFEGSSPEAFASHPYWTRDFIGLGPYRLQRWEPGAFVDGAAFDAHALGRPRIERIRVIPVTDPNTAVANLLAGEAHVAIDDTLRFQQGMILKREWAARDSGRVLFSPSELRYVQIQFKTEYTNPRAILDLRVRKALAHAIDKQALAQGLLEEEGQGADTMVPATIDYYSAVERALTRYPYDLRRVDQLMAEGGLTKGTDGYYVATSSGEPFTPEVRATQGGQETQENAILVDGWRRAGIDARSYILPAAQGQDRQVRATFPAFAAATSQVAEQTLIVKLTGGNIARAENRWAGSNRGGWFHPEYDRLYEAWNTTLSRAERSQQMVQMMKLVSEELAIFPLYHNLTVVAHVASLVGPVPSGSEGSGATWNIHEWRWR